MSSNYTNKPSMKRLSVSITAETEAELIKYAKREDVSMSWVIRKALIEFLDKNLKQRQLPLGDK